MKSRPPIRALAALLPLLFLLGCMRSQGAVTDITGAMPALEFSMVRANDGAAVTAADYRGRVTVLYFGYTNCPDVCPTTLANLATVLQALGAQAKKLRVLFVTVDPDRNSSPPSRPMSRPSHPRSTGCAEQRMQSPHWRGVTA